VPSREIVIAYGSTWLSSALLLVSLFFGDVSLLQTSKIPVNQTIPTVFATVGDEPETLDLSTYEPNATDFVLVESSPTATLTEDELTLDPEAPTNARTVIEAVTPSGRRLLEVWHAVQPSRGPAYPISVYEGGGPGDRRYLVDALGQPVLLLGDASWELPTNRTKAEATAYFDDRQNRGFTVGIWRVITNSFTDQSPEYVAKETGTPPFDSSVNGELDLTDPNGAYWRHVDWCFREAYKHGILVVAFPAYIGFGNGGEGVTNWLMANGTSRVADYGEFLAQRYAGTPNLIWGAGGDFSLAGEEAEHDALWNAVVETESQRNGGRPIHLITAKSSRGNSALEDPSYQKDYISLNSTYSKTEATSSETRDDYERVYDGQLWPTLYIEGWYENEHGMTPLDLRQQAYWSLLEGGAGHIFGNCPVWSFGGATNFCNDSGAGVESSYDSEGAQDMAHLSALLATRTFLVDGGAYMGVDGQDGTLITSRKGTIGEANYVPARFNDRVAVVYLPDDKTIQVDLSAFEGVSGGVRATWYNPRDGSNRSAGTYGSSGTQAFSPPAAGDWVLLLDDTDLDLPLPSDPLPVRLSRLEAVQQGETVRVEWRTLQESNNAGFGVERSVGGEAFTEVGFVEGNGDSSRPVKYRFVDRAIPAEATDLRYRLRQVDVDGAATLSAPVSVTYRPAQDDMIVGPYPQPSRTAFTVEVMLDAPTRVQMRLYDTNGRLVRTILSEHRTRGNVVETVSVDNLASGTYFLRVTKNSETTTRKVTVIR